MNAFVWLELTNLVILLKSAVLAHVRRKVSHPVSAMLRQVRVFARIGWEKKVVKLVKLATLISQLAKNVICAMPMAQPKKYVTLKPVAVYANRLHMGNGVTDAAQIWTVKMITSHFQIALPLKVMGH